MSSIEQMREQIIEMQRWASQNPEMARHYADLLTALLKVRDIMETISLRG
jgi:hypothetical protein